MENPCKMQQETLRNASSILIERPKCSAQEAAAGARLLLGCYRKGDAADPDTYTAAIAATLAQFPADVVRKITNPVTGIPAKLAFLPAVAEVRQACEDELNEEIRLARLGIERESEIRNHAIMERRRVAECHILLRAQEIGDEKAASRLKAFSSETLNAARAMALADALWFFPNVTLSKPIEDYGSLNA